MVIGIISVAGTGPLVKLHVTIEATVYKEILKKTCCTAINQPAVFMQNNTVLHNKVFLSEKDITCYRVTC